MSDVVRVKVTVQTRKVGSECIEVIEFDRDVWDGMTEDEREGVCQDAMWEMVEWDWKEVE